MGQRGTSFSGTVLWQGNRVKWLGMKLAQSYMFEAVAQEYLNVLLFGCEKTFALCLASMAWVPIL